MGYKVVGGFNLDQLIPLLAATEVHTVSLVSEVSGFRE
jgi:hypothetical protein